MGLTSPIASSFVDVVTPVVSSNLVAGLVQVVDVVNTSSTPIPTTNLAQSFITLTQPGGTVVNVQWGYTFPESPTEGMIFIKVTP